MTVTSMSKAEFVAKYAWLNPIHYALARSKSKSGTWGERNSRQTIANEKAKSQGYYVAWREQIAIENNPVNIARWIKEENELQQIEDERLLQIQLEKKRIQNEIDRKEFARLKILKDIENERLEKERLENIRLAEIQAPKRAALQAARIEKIKQDDFQRLVEIELQKILNPAIDPAVLPSIVSTSSLLPLGIIAFMVLRK